jgi:aerobic-type carbon monoxide dehydrogenase small subunit (CoxS/CutS family)
MPEVTGAMPCVTACTAANGINSKPLATLATNIDSAQNFLQGGQAMPIEIEVNGKRYPVSYPSNTPLLYVLRDELFLSGAKYGCGEGQCGACTVLIAGAPRRSCQISVGAAVGKPVTTIEGLEKDGRLHPVQQAFLDAGAFQCAYCTSGMIMSSVGLLQANANPSPADVVQVLQGNVCRCGTHPRIIEAVRHAAKLLQEHGQ